METFRHRVDIIDGRIIKTFTDPKRYEKEKNCYLQLSQLIASDNESLTLTTPYLGAPVGNITENVDTILTALGEAYPKLTHQDETFNLTPYVFKDTQERMLSYPDFRERGQKIFDILTPMFPLVEEKAEIICHGDLHRGNVVSDEGFVSLIDWENAFVGTIDDDKAVLAVYSYAEAVDGLVSLDEASEVYEKIESIAMNPPLFSWFFALRAMREGTWQGKTGRVEKFDFFVSLAERSLEYIRD